MGLSCSRSTRGFTLIELMIAVAIVGLLVAIAYPSYMQHIQNSWRESARLCLLDMAQQMERRYAADLGYNLVDANGDKNDDLLMASSCVTEGDMATRYQFSGGPNKNGFSVLARPIGGQASDECGSLGLDQSGKQTASGSAGVAGCW
ncbi:type IV pilin protein [Amphritea sp.]|uniref:type IV pilin protein n=1 Tax=Amphritea sp. TaxID=1872502 RepID=UPI003A8D8110